MLLLNPYAPWYTMPYTVLDTETTGVGDHDRVIQLGLARFEQGKLVDSWSTLIWADVEVPEESTKIHGITTADLASAPTFVEAIPHVIRLCRGAWPAAYNASFDQRMFMASMKRTALTQMHDIYNVIVFDPMVRWFDPLVWVRHIDRFVKGGNKLPQVCMRYGIELSKAHDASSDAIAAGQVLWHIRNEIGHMTATEMLRQQQISHEGWEQRMAGYFKRNGR